MKKVSVQDWYGKTRVRQKGIQGKILRGGSEEITITAEKGRIHSTEGASTNPLRRKKMSE